MTATPLIGLIVTGFVVLKCLEIWSVNPNHWKSSRRGYLMKFIAGVTCLGAIFLTLSMLAGTEGLVSIYVNALRMPSTIEAFSLAVMLALAAYAWVKARRLRTKRHVARLQRQTVTAGIDLSRSLM